MSEELVHTGIGNKCQTYFDEIPEDVFKIAIECNSLPYVRVKYQSKNYSTQALSSVNNIISVVEYEYDEYFKH